MKIKSEHLNDHLKKNLAPCYLVMGNELLLVDEACDAIRNKARQHGFEEQTTFVIEDASFDPFLFQSHSENFSLFSNKKWIELRCLTEKIPEKLGHALLAYTQQPSPDLCVLIRCNKLSTAQQNTAWFKALDRVGVIIPIWPIEFSRLPQWIAHRLKNYNLVCDEGALRLLARRGENNLYFLIQTIEKLHILFGEKTLSIQHISEAMEDQSRFQLFDLVEPMLSGDKEHVLHILIKLQEEGVEPTLVLWLLTKEIRELIQNKPVFERKKQFVSQALKRHSIKKWEHFLIDALYIDQLIKGAESGSAWQALQRWVLQL